MIGKLPNVQVFPGSRMSAADIADFGADHVVLATGSRWRRDGIGVVNMDPLALPEALTPDDIFAGAPIHGPVVIFDDEHYFMGGALAEKLRTAGHEVTLVTPHATASSWTAMTDEQGFVQARLLHLGVRLELSTMLTGQSADTADLACAYTGAPRSIPCGALILVTGRLPVDDLHRDLAALGITADRVGDCLQPSSIADAVHSAHRYARNFGSPPAGVLRREIPSHRSV